MGTRSGQSSNSKLQFPLLIRSKRASFDALFYVKLANAGPNDISHLKLIKRGD